ncbi:MAG: glycoside hydrolase TIM-barrel-like domain-containing protein [Pseudomonadota bacterium]
MATVLLGAAGGVVGGAIGGSVLGVSAATIGQAIGATAGSFIDQAILGPGSAAVETGRARSLRLQGSTEGAPIPVVWGRMRIAGQLIWSTKFLEHVSETTQGGKATGGGGGSQTVREYSYSISFAVALCEGPIDRIGRVWADGALLDTSTVTMRPYLGDETQLPDPKMQAVEGADAVPAYRGIAYVVFEDFQLGPFGNRIPQLNFEVFRSAQPGSAVSVEEAGRPLRELIKGVALSPGTGEFSLETAPVQYVSPGGAAQFANVSNASGVTDFEAAMDQLDGDLPDCDAISLVVTWFGDDLRCGQCLVQPRIEYRNRASTPYQWTVAGLTTADAPLVSTEEGRPNFGGTPSDLSVVHAIKALNARGKRVMVYPFLLMDVPPGNGRPDPYSSATDQPVFPWRGRITLDDAPGEAGSTDQTAAAAAEVGAFFGTATAADFAVSGEAVSYGGPAEWGYRRFVLHLAALAKAGGGVDSFCVGTEMRSLTQIRSDRTVYPAVDEFKALAAEVRTLLPTAKLGYAADWSEYFGHQPQDGSGDVIFHLDPLWADPNIDFVGIDDYMPLSDWRYGTGHLDAAAGTASIYALPYLEGNVEGGEYYDWYYGSDADRGAQARTPIVDSYAAPANQAPSGSADYALSAGSGPSFATSERQDQAVFRVQLTMPSTLSDGLIFEAGGSGRGVWLGLRDGGATLRMRAGTGSNLPDTGTGVVDVPTAGLEGQSFELMVWIERPGDTVHVYFDGVEQGSGTASAGFGTNEWAGSNASTVGTGVGASITTGEPADAFPGTLGSAFEIWIGAAPEQGSGAPLNEHWVFRPKDIRAWWSNPHHNRIGGVRETTPTAWVPEGKPVWLTETGCPAVDMGANQPNVFFDGKSSESALPYASLGARDDEMQRRFLQAKIGYWDDAANNPVSSLYGDRMIPADSVFVWTWDARPWPDFPVRESLWADGPAYRLGHWVSGRISANGLAEVVAEICARSGLTRIDVGGLYGTVSGYLLDEIRSAREALQPLMLAYGFEAFESAGQIVFQHRGGSAGLPVNLSGMVEGDASAPVLERSRASAGATQDVVRLSYVQAENDYRLGAAEARLPNSSLSRVGETSLPLTMAGAQAQLLADRWLAENLRSRDTASFALPPSALALEPGDVVALDFDGRSEAWRIDRISEGAAREVEAVRVETALYLPAPRTERSVEPELVRPPGPINAVFLDLPAAEGQGEDHQPFLAVAADPWPGTVSVYRSEIDEDYSAIAILRRPATMGVLEEPLVPGLPARWHRATVRVQLAQGALAGATEAAVLNGANRLGVEVSAGEWEVLQFRDADMVDPGAYRIGHFLRGQRGTEHHADTEIPAGARVVLLDEALIRLPLPLDELGLPRHYRTGPARYGFAHASFAHQIETARGVGLRPFRPSQLRVLDQGGDLALSWIRRGRIGADSWEGVDIPLGEEREEYRVRVYDGANLLRSETVTAPAFTYTAAMRADDAPTGPVTLRVSQLSTTFGYGPANGVKSDG